MKNLRLFSKVNHTATVLGIHSVSQAQRELVLYQPALIRTLLPMSSGRWIGYAKAH
jgi:hypothetical protein